MVVNKSCDHNGRPHTHAFHANSLTRREKQQENDEGDPSDGDGADWRGKSAQREIPRYKFISSGCYPQKDRGGVGDVKPNNRSPVCVVF